MDIATRHRERSATPVLLSPAALQRIAGGLLAVTVCFNAALALLNGHAAAIGYAHVAAVQTLLTGGALAIALVARPPGAGAWWLAFWAATCGFLLLSLLRGQVDLKYLADLLTIVGFVLLGMSLRRATIAHALVAIQILLVAAAAWELAAPGSFGDVFKVRDYYVATRGVEAEAFWAGDNNLYLSAERPSGRLIGPDSLHRASSLFLEPVSLGNWTIVVALAIAGLGRRLGRRQVAVLLLGNLVLLLACDGRLALAINLILLLSWPILPHLPRSLPPLFLPLTFLGLWAMAGFGLLPRSGDTLGGRYRYGLDYVLRLDLPALLGLYDKGGVVAADSGWAYLILTQSIFGLAAIWLGVTLHRARGTAEQRRLVAGMAIFISLCLPISFSMMSIKTAGFMWAIFGCVVAGARDRPDPPPAGYRPAA